MEVTLPKKLILIRQMNQKNTIFDTTAIEIKILSFNLISPMGVVIH